jgi:hypothetical protein
MSFEIPRPYHPLSFRKRVLTARERVLAEWRGIDLTEQEIAQQKSVSSVAELMPNVLKGIGFEQRETEVQVVKVWNNFMDPAVRDHAQPVGLRKGTLFVRVDSNVWLDELVRYRYKEILKRLQHAFGRDLISKISFRVGG